MSMNHKSGIYKITNINNGKLYIGSTVNFASRKRIHFHRLKTNKHHSIKLQNSFVKNGIDSFEFEVILICSPENLIMYEQILIDSYKPFYNIAAIAGKTTGYKHTEETKSKFHLRKKAVQTAESNLARSLKVKGRKFTEEQKKNMYWGKGRVVSEETKEKLRLANLGKKRGPMSEEQKKKASNTMKGRKPSEATVLAVKLALTGRPQSEETKKKRADKLRGRKWSEETRQKFLNTWERKRMEMNE